MIRLRCQLERGLRHPVLGPLLLLALVVLVAFIALHETSEGMAGHAELICIAIAIVLLVAVPLIQGLPVAARPAGTQSSRAPPRAHGALHSPRSYTLGFHPLRL